MTALLDSQWESDWSRCFCRWKDKHKELCDRWTVCARRQSQAD